MEESVSCNICWDLFQPGVSAKQPRNMPCGHTLCTACLGDVLRLAVPCRTCPTCRHALAADQLSSFARNFALEAVIGRLQDQTTLSLCSPELPASRLQLQSAVIAHGKHSVVKAGKLTFGDANLKVAVKMLTPAALSQTTTALDFKQEVVMSIQAAHSCSQACRVFGYSYVNKQLCLVMEYHDKSLQSLLKGNRVPHARAAELSLQLAKAVQQLHAVQILHLNIRPENVLLDQHGSILLSDFGRARQVQAGLLDVPVPAANVASVTDCYMSSEAGNPLLGCISCASDVWSLAATIFHIYTGLASSGIPAIWPIELPMPTYMPWSLQYLLKNCFSFLPCARPSVDELVTELQKLVASKAPMEATGSNPAPPSAALAAKIATANKAAAAADKAAAKATLATAAAEAAARQASAAMWACSWTIPATVHPQAYDSNTYDQSPAYPRLSYLFGKFDQEVSQEDLLVRQLASARARRPPKVFMGGETETRPYLRYRRSGQPIPATPLDGQLSGQLGIEQLRLKSKSESDDRNIYYPVGQESTTALGNSFNTTACADCAP